MKEQDFLRLMGQIDDKFIDEMSDTYAGEAPELSSDIERRRMTSMNSYRKPKRIGKTLLIAAVIASLFTVAAFAVGYTIHQRRQAELRQTLQIDEANVQSYVEYATPESDSEGVTLLSAIRNAKEQIVYVNISPVEKDEASNYPYTAYYFATIDGGRSWLSARPVIGQDDIYSQDGDLAAAVYRSAYNEETKTLTVSCSIQNSELSKQLDADGRVELRLVRVDDEAFKNSGLETVPDWLAENDTAYGSVMVSPIESEMQLITFTPTTLTDAQTGMDVTVLSLELYPTEAVWHLKYDGAEELYGADELYGTAQQEELLHLEDFICQNAVLRFSDGSELAPGGAQTSSFKDGVALPSSSWLKAIDIHKLESVTIGDVELTISR